jgi:16S rRNA (cytosine967-C5)-methyltransferase
MRAQNALDGRTAAVMAVTDALSGEHFVNETLRELRGDGRLSGREAGLAMEIAQGAVRHAVTLDHVLQGVARYRPRQTALGLRAVLLTAAYQIIWMDRIPNFAAVDEAVVLARRTVRGRAPGMVNAVLRRLTGAITEERVGWQRLDPTQVRVSWDQACKFDRPVLPAAKENDPSAHLAAATGERRGRFAALCERWEPDLAERVAWASQAVPVTVLQRNSRRATADAFEQYVRTAGGETVEFAQDTAFVPATVSIFDAPAFQDGLVYVQDTTAHAAAQAVEARPGERVLDVCAAPGGKSIALALAMDDHGRVVACDTAPTRLMRVDANVTRLGLNCVRTRLHGPTQADVDAGDGKFDAALVDVPCSNTGVIARRPEARLGLTRQKLRSLVAVQRELLRTAADWVRPQGRVVYSTCSLEPEENEEVVAAFLKKNPAWRLVREKTLLPAWGPRASDWRDGGYYARLEHASRTE